MPKSLKTQLPGSQESSPSMTGYGCLVRIGWMLAGNALLAIFAFKIAGQRGLIASVFDLLFWGVALALILLRRYDITRLHGLTSSGQAATLAHWRRYALGLLLVCAAVWAAAHAVGIIRTPS